MAIDIKEFLITPTTIITVFKAKAGSHTRLEKDGTISYGTSTVDMEFANYKSPYATYYKNHELVEIYFREEVETKLEIFFNEIKYNCDKDKSSVTNLLNFLEQQEYDYNLEPSSTSLKLYIIIPIVSKKLIGKPFKNEFEVCNTEFHKIGFVKMELDVYMTKITKYSKSVKFSVYIPDYIYDKCMENNEISKRPRQRFIESENLGELHNKMYNLSKSAVEVSEFKKSSETSKKKIVIDFFSMERMTKDSFRHAFTGRNIETKFRWYIVHEFLDYYDRPSYFSYLRVEEGKVIDWSLTNQKAGISGTPSGVIIDWTPEREQFCQELEVKFRTLSTNLNQFLKDLDSEKIDNLIQNNSLKSLQ